MNKSSRGVVVTAEFEGMRPWEPSSEIIECSDTVLGNVDMHNDCDFEEAVASIRDNGLTLSLYFAKIEGSSKERFALRFHGVQRLSLASREVELSEDRNVFHAIDYVEKSNAEPEFSVDTEMLTLSFRCQKVQFEAVV